MTARAHHGAECFDDCRRRRRRAPLGTVYLLHFSEPYKHARHYMGWSADVESRAVEHMRGAGAKLTAAAAAAGVAFTLAREWTGTRALERHLKNLGGLARVCPICSPRPWGGTLPARPAPAATRRQRARATAERRTAAAVAARPDAGYPAPF